MKTDGFNVKERWDLGKKSRDKGNGKETKERERVRQPKR